MSNRRTKTQDFLRPSMWHDWTMTCLAADASSRRYARLTRAGQSVILMDADPAEGHDTVRFAAIANILKSAGLSPPDILAHDPQNGFMVLSDLGKIDVAHWLVKQPYDQRELYVAATDILVSLYGRNFDIPLDRLTPEVGGKMIGVLNPSYTQTNISDLAREVTKALGTHAAAPNTLALRDYHAENLIWRPDMKGADRIGLLDFQDAIWAPAGYDLASLIRDARRDVDTATVETLINYFVAQTGAGTGFHDQVACLGAQRNLRILGIFARLAKSAGKTRYLSMLPRVWRNLLSDLERPALTDLREAVLDTLPEPNKTQLDKLRQ